MREGGWRGSRARRPAQITCGKRPCCAAVLQPGRAEGGLRTRRPRAVARLRSGRAGRPSCTETGQFRDAFCDRDTSGPSRAETGRIRDAFDDRDTNPGRKGAGRGPRGGRAARYPRSASAVGRKTGQDVLAGARFRVPIAKSVTESVPHRARSPRREAGRRRREGGGRERRGQAGDVKKGQSLFHIARSRPSRT